LIGCSTEESNPASVSVQTESDSPSTDSSVDNQSEAVTGETSSAYPDGYPEPAEIVPIQPVQPEVEPSEQVTGMGRVVLTVADSESEVQYLFLARSVKTVDGVEAFAAFDRAEAPRAVFFNGEYVFSNVKPGRYVLILDRAPRAASLVPDSSGQEIMIEVAANEVITVPPILVGPITDN
ncbi:MAG: hypothetical protein ACPG8W_16200, partial [Candidatus Promineifilaceae bacterium]